MASEQAEIFRFLRGRAAAVLSRLEGDASRPATPGVKAELEGLQAVAATLAAADPKFSAARDLITQLALLTTSLTAGVARVGTKRKSAKRRKDPPSTCATVLGDRELLPLILQWVGPGHWLLVASTSPRFRAAYMAVVAAAAPKAFCRTMWRAVLLGTHTFLLAADCGAVREEGFREAVGQWAPRDVLNCATGVEFKLQVCRRMLRGAARGLNFEAVKRIGGLLMRANGGVLPRLDAAAAALEAARSGDGGAVLGWLGHARHVSDSGEWPKWLASTLCASAARGGHLATVQWMRTRGQQRYGEFSVTDYWQHDDLFPLYNDGGDPEMAEQIAEEGEEGARFRELADEYITIPEDWEGTFDAVESAAHGGHLHIVKYLCHDVTVQVTCQAPAIALDAGFPDVAVFLLRRGVFNSAGGVNGALLSLAAADRLTLELAHRLHADGIGQWSPQFVAQLLERCTHTGSPESMPAVRALVQWLQQLRRA